MNDKNKEVLVIGAGMGGLSSAILLQHEGYQVTILEKNQQPGGKMARLQKDGFTFDVGPTIVMMPKIYEEVFSSVGKNPSDYIELIKCNPLYDVYFKDEPYRHYTLKSELDELMKMVESRGQAASIGFLKYLADIYERYNVALDHFIRRPFRYKRDMYNPFMLKQAFRLKTLNSASDMMAKYIEDTDLQQMMAFQTLYIGVSPKKGPSLYNIIPMIELLYGVYYVKGGMHAMALAMEKVFKELGGQIEYNTPVEKIVVEEKAVKGVLVNGQLRACSLVISDVDFPTTMTSLIEDKITRGKYTPEKIDSMDYACSCLVFYWGVKGTYKNLKVHNFVITKDLDENLEQIFDGRKLTDPSLYLHVPSQVDSSVTKEGHSTFYCLMPVSELSTAKYSYNESIINEYKEKAFKTLSGIEGLENLEEKIVTEMIFTPDDFKEAFGAYNGATFGLQPTLKQSNHFRPQSKSLQCEGLYFTGSSTHPGAGVPIAIEGGRICAGELIKDTKQ